MSKTVGNKLEQALNRKQNMENWNKLCYYLSEKINDDILEREFEPIVEKGLEILGWNEFSGDFEIRPNFQLGSTKNSLKPDFLIKSNENGEKLFVIEIKRPKTPLSRQNQTQLSTYMRQFKLHFGILIGPQIQIFYDGDLNDQENAVLIENIDFKRESEKGKQFVKLFSKESFNQESLKAFAVKSLKKINRREEHKKLTEKILSDSFQDKMTELIIQDFLNEYDGELIEAVLNELEVSIREKNKIIIQSELPKRQYHLPNEIVYSKGILPIELNPPTEIEFKQRLLLTKTAYITTFYKNGTSKQKIWNAQRFKESSGVLGNLRSRPEFRNGKWQKLGIEKVLVSIDI
jgi:hypothetical protein